MENRKKSVKKIIILVVSIAVTILAALIVCRILMVRAYRAHKDQVIHEIDYSSYVWAMGGSIDWNQELESDFVPDDRTVTMRLAFYNYENGCTLTLEELKSQFAISKTETEGIDDLIAYSKFINKEGISDGMNDKYFNCRICCNDILINNGIDPDEATLEELTEAFNKAIEVQNYMIENGYDACIKRMPDGYYIQDLNATNGTYVDGVKVEWDRDVRLVSGCIIRIADEEFEFIIS